MNRITKHIRNGGSTARTMGPARPYRPGDVLESLPHWRARFIKQRAAGHSLAFTEYGHLLKLAMKPVLLPPDFAVSSETAAHFNRLNRSFDSIFGRAA